MRRLSSFGQTAIVQGPSVGMAGVAMSIVRTKAQKGTGCSQRLPVFLPACIASFQVRWRWTKVPAHQVCPGAIPFLAPSRYFYLRKQNSDSQKNILCQLLNSAHKAGPESLRDTVYTTCLVHCLRNRYFACFICSKLYSALSRLSLNTRTTASFARLWENTSESPMTDIPLSVPEIVGLVQAILWLHVMLGLIRPVISENIVCGREQGRHRSTDWRERCEVGKGQQSRAALGSLLWNGSWQETDMDCAYRGQQIPHLAPIPLLWRCCRSRAFYMCPCWWPWLWWLSLFS